MAKGLELATVAHEAAKYAVTNWHYSRSMPTPPVVKFGVWEDGQFIGVVLFSRGAGANLGSPYGLKTTQIAELTRVALASHVAPVSQIVARAIAILRVQSPGLRLIISFADPYHGHHGGIYQAGNWIYVGKSAAKNDYIDSAGRRWHDRQVSASGWKRQYGELRRVPKTGDCTAVRVPPKYRYAYPLDKAMRRQVTKMSKPYPRGQSIDSDTSESRSEGLGATPSDRSTVLPPKVSQHG